MTTQQATNSIFDATRESYTGAIDAWNQAQSRAIRLSRIWLDEVEATQQESRRAADQIFSRTRQAQEAWLSMTQENLRNASSFWRWPAFPTMDEVANRLDDLNRKVDADTSATIKVAK